MPFSMESLIAYTTLFGLDPSLSTWLSCYDSRVLELKLKVQTNLSKSKPINYA